MRTRSQRMAALDTAILQINSEERRSSRSAAGAQMRRIEELLREYRSWGDDPEDGDEAFLTIHDDLNAQFAELLSRTRDPGINAKVLDIAIDVARLLDSVPWHNKGPARLLAAAQRELSITTWAERVALLPDGPLRDLAAYPLDIVHVLFGDHHGGEECYAVAMAFSDGGTVVTRALGPVYLRLLQRT